MYSLLYDCYTSVNLFIKKRETTKRMKRQMMDWKKIFVNIFDNFLPNKLFRIPKHEKMIETFK